MSRERAGAKNQAFYNTYWTDRMHGMIDLETFGDISTISIGAFSAKPTSLTEDQKEAAKTLWQSEDGLISIGVWECTPGHFTADRSEAGEYCHIISGTATVRNHDGTKEREIRPGDLLILPQGWKGEWVIHEHMRKLYIISAKP